MASNRDDDPRHGDAIPDTLLAATAPAERAEHIAPQVHIGQVLADRFRVEAKLGAGGMGIVYRALDDVLKRAVAIKVLYPHIGKDAHLVARFFREAQIVAQLSSNPNVITIYDFGRTPDHAPYLVMEYLTGKSLGAVINDAATSHLRLARSYVLDVSLQIAAALLDAHNAGIVHRDLKPDNVFVLETRVIHHLVKVLDFGIARSVGRPLPDQFATQRGAFVGTPKYAAPEFFSDEAPSPASDVYAFGLILYELATKRFPLQASTFLGWLRAHTSDTPEPFPQQDPAYPPALSSMVTAMLDKSPGNRPRVDEILRQLSLAQEELRHAKR